MSFFWYSFSRVAGFGIERLRGCFLAPVILAARDVNQGDKCRVCPVGRVKALSQGDKE